MTKEEQNHSQTPKEVGARTLRRRKHVALNRADAHAGAERNATTKLSNQESRSEEA
jgi:hypothetical protein